jgi:hypothetical protein
VLHFHESGPQRANHAAVSSACKGREVFGRIASQAPLCMASANHASGFHVVSKPRALTTDGDPG